MQKLLLTFLCVFLLISCKEEAPEPEENIRPIAWMELQVQGINQIRKLSGVLVSAQKAELSFEISGQVQKVNADLGDKVTKGMILAEINKSDYKNALTSAEADYANSKSLLKRMKMALESNAVSRQEYSDAKTKFEVAEANLKIRQKAYNNTVLRAPYNGIITKKAVEPAQQVSIGQVLFDIEGESGLEVSVTVPETLIQKIENKKVYSVSFPSLKGVRLPAKVVEIGTQAQVANSFPVTLILEETSKELRAGMTAEVLFSFIGEGLTGNLDNVMIVPNGAVGVGTEESKFVFVYNPETQTVKKVAVETQNIIGNNVYITGDLNSGDIIAIAGVSYLRDGQKVSLIDKETRIFN